MSLHVVCAVVGHLREHRLPRLRERRPRPRRRTAAPWSSGHGGSSSTSVPSASNSTASYRPPGTGAAPAGSTGLRRRRGPARRRRCAPRARRRRRPAPGSRSGAPSRRAARGRSGSDGRQLVHVRAARLVGELPAARGAPSRAAARPCRGIISSVTITGASTEPDCEVIRAMSPSASRGRGGVVGVDAQRVRAAAAHQQRRVVHPGVVRAQLAQPDQAEREVAGRRRSADSSRATSASATASPTCTRRSRWRTRSPSTPVAMWSPSTIPCGRATRPS